MISENALIFAENFSQVHFISDSSLEEDGKVVHELNYVNVQPFLIFIAIVVFVLPLVLFLMGTGIKTILGVPVAVVVLAGCVIGAIWLVNQNHLNGKLPHIDKELDELVLPSCNRVARTEIQQFRRFDCKTKNSNFRLALTSVVTREQQQFAVCIETNTSGSIGKQIAEYFEKEIEHYPSVVSSTEDLKTIGIL